MVEVVLNMQGGDSDSVESPLARNAFQKAIGLVLMIYGFFMAAFPERYTLPILTRLTINQNAGVGLVFLLVGAYLLITNRSLIGV